MWKWDVTTQHYEQSQKLIHPIVWNCVTERGRSRDELEAVEGQHRHVLQEGVELQTSSEDRVHLRQADQKLSSQLRMVKSSTKNPLEVPQKRSGTIVICRVARLLDIWTPRIPKPTF